MEMIPDTKVVEHRNMIMLRAKQIHEQEDLSIENIEGLLRQSAEIIDELRGYCFQRDLDCNAIRDHYVDLQKSRDKEVARGVKFDEALQISKAEVVMLREENDELREDKIMYRNMVQHYVDEH